MWMNYHHVKFSLFHSEHYDMTLYIYIIELVGEPHRRVKQALSSGILADVFQKISVVGGHCRNHLFNVNCDSLLNSTNSF